MLVHTAIIVVLVVLMAASAAGVVALSVELAKVTTKPHPCKQVSSPSSPLVTTVPHFVSDAEADHLIQLASGRFAPSVTVDAKTSARVRNRDRTSYTVFLEHGEDATVRNIEQRAAQMLQLPAANLERLQVVRYAPGQFYKAHYDWIEPSSAEVKMNGQRLATLFVYLNTLPASEPGGGTHFPKLNLTVRPVKGTAAVWSNVLPNTGKVDDRTLHAGQEVKTAVKYGLNIWFRDRPQS